MNWTKINGIVTTIVAIAALMGTLGTGLLSIGGEIRSIPEQSERNCRQIQTLAKSLQDILRLRRAQARIKGENGQSELFYDEAIRRLEVQGCGESLVPVP